jgi:hypothetical protein
VSDVRHDDVRELLGAYALDAVSDDEAQMVLAHLSTCPSCSEEVAQHHEIAAMLANTGGEAPAHVWERIEARLDTSGPVVDLSAHRGARPGTRTAVRSRAPRWIGIAAAAILVIGFTAEVIHLQDRVGQLQGASPAQQVMRAARTALHDPAASDVNLHSASSGRLAEIAILPSGAAYLVNDGLAALPASRTYQLWGQVGTRLISLGLLGNDPSAIAFEVGSSRITFFAVTDELAGGAVQPTRAPVAIST